MIGVEISEKWRAKSGTRAKNEKRKRTKLRKSSMAYNGMHTAVRPL